MSPLVVGDVRADGGFVHTLRFGCWQTCVCGLPPSRAIMDPHCFIPARISHFTAHEGSLFLPVLPDTDALAPLIDKPPSPSSVCHRCPPLCLHSWTDRAIFPPHTDTVPMLSDPLCTTSRLSPILRRGCGRGAVCCQICLRSSRTIFCVKEVHRLRKENGRKFLIKII